MFHPNKLLPKSLIIVGADTNLYRIGLSLFKKRIIKKRFMNKPFIIYIIIIQILLRSVFYLKFIRVNDPVFHLIIGNMAYFSGPYLEVNICASLITLISFCSMILHWYNYFSDIKPIDNRLFEMMAGLIKPKCIGIYEEQLCLKLLKISRRGLFIAKYVDISLFIFLWIILFPLYMPFITNFNLLIIGIFHTLLWAISCAYIYRIIVYQTVYYYILTYYIKLRLIEYNEQIKFILKNNKYLRYSQILAIMSRLYKIHDEINEYNCCFWSKYLCIFWFNITAVISLLISFILFSNNLSFKLLLMPIILLFIGILYFIIHISAAIHSESNNSYKLFNSLYCQQNYNNFAKFKVNFLQLLIKSLRSIFE